MSRQVSLFQLEKQSLVSRLATGLHWRLVYRVTTVGHVSEVDITFALG